MSIESIAALSASTVAPISLEAARPAQGAVFESVLDGIREVNQQMQAAKASVEALVVGNTDNLHQVMMQSEQARLSFELLLQVRNKVLEAYQELMRMQV